MSDTDTTMNKVIVAIVIVTLLLSGGSYLSTSGLGTKISNLSDTFSSKIDDLDDTIEELVSAESDLASSVIDLGTAVGESTAELSAIEERLKSLEEAKPTPTPTEKKTILIGTSLGVTQHLDPGTSWGPETLHYQVFDPLYRLKTGVFPEVEYVPNLALGEPIISDDGLEYTIQLRQGVKFHDGTKFNAVAYQFSIHRAIEEDQWPAWMLSPIDRVEVVGDYTIKIILKHPFAALKGILLQGVACPVSPTAVQKMTTVEFQEKPVGTGPFKYVEWVKEEYIAIERNEDYWNKDAMPKVDRIVWKLYTDVATMKLALEKGEIDIIWSGLPSTDIPSLLENPNIEHEVMNEMYLHWITLNVGLPNSPLRDVRVRQAIAYCIDQDEISTKVFHDICPAWKDSVFITGLMSKPSWLPWTEKVDINKAKQLLEDAGYPDGIDMTLWYTMATRAEEADLAVVLQEQLAKAGIRVHFEAPDKAQFYGGFKTGEYESALAYMGPDWPDPDSVAFFISHSSASYPARVLLNNTEIDELVIQGRIISDPDERERIYGELQDKLAEQMCYIPLVQFVDYIFYRTDITGVESYYILQPPWWLLGKK